MGHALPTEELWPWFALLQVRGVGRPVLRQLLAHFGSPSAVLQADRDALTTLIGREGAVSLEAPFGGSGGPITQRRWRQTLAWLDEADDHQVLVLGDAAYPAALLESPDPPLMLYAQGDLGALQAPALALVGSRQATPQGCENAHAFARELAAQGYAIVSGLAEGIDAAAHEGALATPAGRTVAVVGTGLDVVYPPQHGALAARIRNQGCLLSEHAPGTAARAFHFPQRNRIIAGLSQGTLVVEAALRSGSLITARLANEAGREVFAIPGSIHAPQAKGCHALIKQGAKLVESAADVLEELQGVGVPAAPADAASQVHRRARRARVVASSAEGLAPAPASLWSTADADSLEAGTDLEPASAHAPLLAALGHDACSLDELQARCGWRTEDLLAALLELELQGTVHRLPGARFQRRHQA